VEAVAVASQRGGECVTWSIGSRVPMGLARPRPSVLGLGFFEVFLGHELGRSCIRTR
jgi:hypothetical protein